MHLQEVILCSVVPSTPGQGAGKVSIYDLNTGATLFSLKQTSANEKCTFGIETFDGHGGLILAAQSDKALLNVYSYQKDQLHLRIVLPEKLTCIATDHNGDYVAGGTQAGKVYLWEVSSGILFNVFDAHYRGISVLKFTSDGSALVTASEDSGASVWLMSRLLDNQMQHDVPAPYAMLSDHTLPVTDVYCGAGLYSQTRIITSSTDNTCKLWDLSSRTLLTTFLFPHPITRIVMDSTERIFFAASPNGDIHQINLFRKPTDDLGRHKADSLHSSERIELDELEKQRLISVGSAVTSMAISMTGAFLIVGTAAGDVHVYDIASHQLIRKIASSVRGMRINDVQTMLKPPDLMGHANLRSPLALNENIPIRPISAFQRTKDPKARQAHEVLVMPVPNSLPSLVPTMEAWAEDQLDFVQPQTAASTNGTITSGRVADLERELAQVRLELNKAKGLNNALWESTVSAILAEKSKDTSIPTSEGNSANGDEGRRRKRGRNE